MRRRDVLIGGGAAAVWPLASRAQQAMPVVGFLHSSVASNFTRFVAAFHQGLKEQGFIVGQNVAIEERWAEGRYLQLPDMAKELVGRNVAVVATMGGEITALAAKGATSTIPITFVMGSDPVKLGLVASLNRPGGNVTGISQFTASLEAKRFGLLHELVPRAKTIAAIINPSRAVIAANQLKEVQAAARQAGVRLVVLNVSAESELERAIASAREQAAALQVCADPYLFSRHRQIVALVARYKIPAMYEWRDFPMAGGLASYGTDLADSYRLNGNYAGRLLKGESPADLPVQLSTRFEFVINLKAAQALGLEVAAGLSARADEIIE